MNRVRHRMIYVGKASLNHLLIMSFTASLKHSLGILDSIGSP
jgi:hypothetical protein